jgi:xanthine dehydrogenase accessory factor
MTPMVTFDELDRIRASEKRAAVATLVATKGTSPRKEGARMWVGEAGAILGSVTIGGCVDAEVVRVSEEVLKTSSPRLLSMELGDEDAHALGLTCAGTVEVLVRAVDLEAGDAMTRAWDRARGHAATGGRAVIVTPLGESPAGQGAVLVVLDDGSAEGTLGDGALDAEAATLAGERMQKGVSRTLTLTSGSTPVEAFFEVLGRGPQMTIVGAGAITLPLTRMAKSLGMHVVVVDGRERFADPSRFPEADEVLGGMPSEVVETGEYDANSAVVVVAHDYKYDIPVLRAALRTGAGYVGMLGSRKRGGTILKMLIEDGEGEDAIARIRTPIGLDIGGQSAEEIALSILAEVVAVRNGRPGGPMRNRDGNVGRT